MPEPKISVIRTNSGAGKGWGGDEGAWCCGRGELVGGGGEGIGCVCVGVCVFS